MPVYYSPSGTANSAGDSFSGHGVSGMSDPGSTPYAVSDPARMDAKYFGEPLESNVLGLWTAAVGEKDYRILWACPAGLSVGQPCRINGAGTLALATADTEANSKAIGFVRQKATTTTCWISHFHRQKGCVGFSASDVAYLSDTGTFAPAQGTIKTVIGVCNGIDLMLCATPTSFQYSGYSGASGSSGQSGFSGAFSGASGYSGQSGAIPALASGDRKIKASGTTRTSADPIAIDPDLSLTVVAGKSYAIDGVLLTHQAYAGDQLKVKWEAAGGGTIDINLKVFENNYYFYNNEYLEFSGTGGSGVSGGCNAYVAGAYRGAWRVSGYFKATLSGTLDLWWTGSSINAVTLREGSWIECNEGAGAISGASGLSGAVGLSGFSGAFSGQSGTSGESGSSGCSGFSGTYSGYSGESGFSSGVPGPQGLSGSSGSSGGSGSSGESGASGISGQEGYSGASGLPGDSGFSGFSGIDGSVGSSGGSGSSGKSGASGSSGASGATGLQGTSGDSGVSGAVGMQGVPGDSGTSGASGPSGFSGLGLQGTSGDSGFSGRAAGAYLVSQPGHTFVPGDVVYRTTGLWDYAKADNIGTAEALAIVQDVTGDLFDVIWDGPIAMPVPQGWTDGEVYFISESVAGQLTLTEPSTPGVVSKPMLVATSANTGIVLSYRGMVVPDPLANSGYSGYSGASGLSGLTGPIGLSGGSGQSGTSGARGYTGTSGTSGLKGDSGSSGESGLSGGSGYSGTSGKVGPIGLSGTSGTSGQAGPKGDSGTSGYSGKSGASGESGASGVGTSGYSGAKGISGTSGFKGDSGTSGNSGASGLKGDSGLSGAIGVSGTSGLKGDSGLSGAKGTSGDSGASGSQGYSGTSGFSGPSGASGTSGASGAGQSGASGFSGQEGSSGASGGSGTKGDSGASGQSGSSGTSGFSGHSGSPGESGTSGTSGVIGESGFSGKSGASGQSGQSGTSGFSGLNGESGSSGASGEKGNSGIPGGSGTSGTSGMSGFSGYTGHSGVIGNSGAKGDSGTSGTSGSSGTPGLSGQSGSSGFSGTVGQAAGMYLYFDHADNPDYDITLTSNQLAFVTATTPDTLTRADGGSFITNGFQAQQKIKVTGGLNNGLTYPILSVAANTITFVRATAVVNEPAGTTITITVQDEKLTRLPVSGVEVVESQLVYNDSPEDVVGAPIDNYMTVSLVPGQTSIPAGSWEFDFWAYASVASQGYLHFVVCKVDAATFAVTTLFTTSKAEITSVVASTDAQKHYTLQYALASPITLLTTDRIVIRVMATTTTASRTLYWIYQGTSRASHVLTTFSIIPPTGTSGFSGYSGAGSSGSSGGSGTSGAKGTSGESGASGASGTSGEKGSSGTSGVKGDSGTSGPSGQSGTSGFSGTSSGTSTVPSLWTMEARLTLASGTPVSIVDQKAIVPSSTDTGAETVTMDVDYWQTGQAVTVSATAGGLTAGTEYFLRRISSAVYSFYDTLAHAQAGGATGLVDLTAGITATIYSTRIYYAPYNGKYITLYNGTTWSMLAVSEASLSIVGFTASRPYDIFVYDNGGTATLEAVIWTSGSARATELATQDNVDVKSGTTTKRFVGTICMTAATGVCEDSVANRLVSNAYNRRPRQIQTREPLDLWSYSTATWREVNDGTTTTRFNFMACKSDIWLNVIGGLAVQHTSPSSQGSSALGLDSITVPTSRMTYDINTSTTNGTTDHLTPLMQFVGTGLHYVAMLEYVGVGTMISYGDGGSPTWISSGLDGCVEG